MGEDVKDLRFALYSDLHLEFAPWNPPELEVDVVILAGDIAPHTHGLEWAAKSFKQPVIYVAGNHEYYDAQLGLLAELQAEKWEHAGVHFLEKRTVEIAGVRFIGCTLWSGFDLSGEIEENMRAARGSINDYWMIRTAGGKRLEPRDTLRLYRQSWRWLDAELAKPFAGKTVVITHFAPHPGCVAPQHQGSNVSPYFVSDLSDLMAKYRPAAWCYGHTHTNISFVAEGGCQVVCNQLGYPEERAGIGFNDALAIEI